MIGPTIDSTLTLLSRVQGPGEAAASPRTLASAAVLVSSAPRSATSRSNELRISAASEKIAPSPAPAFAAVTSSAVQRMRSPWLTPSQITPEGDGLDAVEAPAPFAPRWSAAFFESPGPDTPQESRTNRGT